MLNINIIKVKETPQIKCLSLKEQIKNLKG